MLQLMQIMTYMLSVLEYTPDEVREAFQAIQSGEYSVEELLDVLGIEPYVPSVMAMIKKHVPKWESVLKVTMMRLEDITNE